MKKFIRSILPSIVAVMGIVSVVCAFIVLYQYRGAEWGSVDFNYPIGTKCEVTSKVIRDDGVLEISVEALKSGEPVDFYLYKDSGIYDYLASKNIGDVVLIGGSPLFQKIDSIFILSLMLSLAVLGVYLKAKAT